MQQDKVMAVKLYEPYFMRDINDSKFLIYLYRGKEELVYGLYYSTGLKLWSFWEFESEDYWKLKDDDDLKATSTESKSIIKELFKTKDLEKIHEN